jgi:hypothetical protein
VNNQGWLRDGKSAAYRELFNFNRANNKGWTNHDMEKAVQIDPANASNVRLLALPMREQAQRIHDEVQGLEEFAGAANTNARYKVLLQLNDRGARGWDDVDMRRVANINSGSASEVRKAHESARALNP